MQGKRFSGRTTYPTYIQRFIFSQGDDDNVVISQGDVVTVCLTFSKKKFLSSPVQLSASSHTKGVDQESSGGH